MQAKRFHRLKKERLYRPVLISLLLALMTLALYWPVQTFDFVNYDDEVYVTNNRQVRGGLSLEGIKWSFTNLEAGFWQPPVWLSHMLDCQLYGMHAGGHHWTSVLIHTAGALLLFFVLSLMTHSPWASALAAALFAVHPLHVESVAWVAERKDVLSGFFWILTMGAYAHYVKGPTLRRYLLVLGSFVLGLLSKPMAVTLPFALLLLDYWPLRRFTGAQTAFDRWCASGPAPLRAPGARLVAEKVPLVVLSAAAVAITYVAEHHVGAVKSMASYPLGVRLANAIVSYALYIRKTIWPVDLAVLYPHLGMPPLWPVLASAVLLVAVTGLAWRLRTRAPYLAVGWSWYLGTLVPVIGLVQIGSHAMADRYTYIPLLGLFIALAWGAKGIVEKRPGWKIGIIGLSVLSGTILLFPARAQIETWQDSVTLFQHALTVTKDNPIARFNIGAHYLGRNDCSKAVPHFQEAIEMKKDFALAFHCLGVCDSRAGNAAGALHYYGQAIAIEPRSKMPRIERGLMLMQQGRLDEAEEDFRQVLRMDPAHEAAHNNMGMLLIRQGKHGEAEARFSDALRVNPRNAEAHNNLGIVCTAQGRTEDAIASFLKARELMPGNAAIETNLRIAREKRQKDTLGKGSI
jgi:tetratricopeptide (TPR) repeat protein